MAARKKGHKRRPAGDVLKLDELAKALDTYTGLISTQIRAIDLGTLALAWSLLLKQSDVAALASRVPNCWGTRKMSCMRSSAAVYSRALPIEQIRPSTAREHRMSLAQ